MQQHDDGVLFRISTVNIKHIQREMSYEKYCDILVAELLIANTTVKAKIYLMP